jgi:hypothetical protein
MRKFVVAAGERSRKVQADPVEAPTVEHAIAKVVKARPRWVRGTVFEAWPKDQPTQVVKFTI